jgi:hypothetical protein
MRLKRMSLNQNEIGGSSDRRKEIEPLKVNELKKLYNSIKPETVLKRKIIRDINEKALDLVRGKRIAIDLELSGFHYLLIAKVAKEFKEAGFKVAIINKGRSKRMLIKL